MKGRGPEDITEISVKLAGHMIHMGGKAESADEGIAMAEEALNSGAALEKFKEFAAGQGGDDRIVDDFSLLPLSGKTYELKADSSGFVEELDAMMIGEASGMTGAGRQIKEDVIDHGAGILLVKKIGDRVEKGDVLCTIYSSDEDKLERAAHVAAHAYLIGSREVSSPELIRSVIE